MKLLITKKYLTALALIGCALPCFCTDGLYEQIRHRVMQETAPENVSVQLTLSWYKQTRITDYTHRSRARLHGLPNVVVTEHPAKDTSCKGVLLSGQKTVVAPEVCLARKNHRLNTLTMRFANGQEVVLANPTAQIRAHDELAFITLTQEVQGLSGAELQYIQKGHSLQNSFEDMTAVLTRFFAQYGIYKDQLRGSTSVIKKHVSATQNNKKLEVGQGVFYKGKLVALVKEVPGDLGSFWSEGANVSEKSLVAFGV